MAKGRGRGRQGGPRPKAKPKAKAKCKASAANSRSTRGRGKGKGRGRGKQDDCSDAFQKPPPEGQTKVNFDGKIEPAEAKAACKKRPMKPSQSQPSTKRPATRQEQDANPDRAEAESAACDGRSSQSDSGSSSSSSESDGEQPNAESPKSHASKVNMTFKVDDEENAELVSPPKGASSSSGVHPNTTTSLQDMFAHHTQNIDRVKACYGEDSYQRLFENVSGLQLVTLYSGIGGAELSAMLIHLALCQRKSNDQEAPSTPRPLLACECDVSCQRVLESHEAG